MLVQHTPELGPPPMQVPQVDYLGTMLELTRYQTDIDVALDHKIHKERVAYARDLDNRHASNRAAFGTIKEASAPPLVEMQQEVSTAAIFLREQDDLVRACCDNPECFDFASPVQINDEPSTEFAKDSFSLTLRTATQEDLPDEAEMTQDQTSAGPKAMLSKLKEFWLPFWYRPDATTEVSAQFEQFVSSLPLFFFSSACHRP